MCAVCACNGVLAVRRQEVDFFSFDGGHHNNDITNDFGIISTVVQGPSLQTPRLY